MAVGEGTIAKEPIKKGSFIQKWLEVNDSRIKELRYSIKLFSKSPLAMLGFFIIVGFILVAILAPFITPYPESFNDLANVNKDPSADHILGTDTYGGDLYSKILWGSRVSLVTGFLVVGFAIVMGTVVGCVSAYYGGWIDEIVMRVTDIFLGFPSLVLAMVICAALGSSLENVMIAMAIVWWPAYARIIRGQALAIKERKFIEAAKATGASDFRIIWKHLIPNSFSPIIVQATMDLGTIIITSAALSFIGMGAGPGDAEWGRMVSDGREQLQFHPGVATLPGLAILVVCLGFNLFGDGLRDIMDPKMRR